MSTFVCFPFVLSLFLSSTFHHQEKKKVDSIWCLPPLLYTVFVPHKLFLSDSLIQFLPHISLQFSLLYFSHPSSFRYSCTHTTIYLFEDFFPKTWFSFSAPFYSSPLVPVLTKTTGLIREKEWKFWYQIPRSYVSSNYSAIHHSWSNCPLRPPNLWTQDTFPVLSRFPTHIRVEF